MDQRALGELAEKAAALAERQDAAALSALVTRAADRHHLANWTVVSLIAQEWDRLGIRRTPKALELARVPRGTLNG